MPGETSFLVIDDQPALTDARSETRSVSTEHPDDARSTGCVAVLLGDDGAGSRTADPDNSTESGTIQ